MPQVSNTAARRAQIVDALITVMAARGYDGATIADVARAAGLGAGLVHYHFASKRAILVEAVRVLGARHAAALDAALAAAGSPAAELVAFVEVHLGLGAHAAPAALASWVLAVAEGVREPEVRREVEAVLAAQLARAAAIVRRGHAAGALRCPDADAAAAALVATIQGYYTLAATARALIPRGSAAACALRMLDGLVRPRAPLAPSPRRRGRGARRAA